MAKVLSFRGPSARWDQSATGVTWSHTPSAQGSVERCQLSQLSLPRCSLTHDIPQYKHNRRDMRPLDQGLHDAVPGYALPVVSNRNTSPEYM